MRQITGAAEAKRAARAGGNHKTTDASMSTEWYYQIMNDEVGPLTSKELLDRVRSGQVKKDTPIRKDDSQWVNAEEVGGLFDAAERKEIEHSCPFCGNKVAEPPTTCGDCGRRLVLSFSSEQLEAEQNGAPISRAEEIETMLRRMHRRDILRYSILLLFCVLVLVGAPYIIYLANTGKLVYDTQTTAISVAAATALIAVMIYGIVRLGES